MTRTILLLNMMLQVAAAQQCLLVLMVKGWFTGTITC